MENPRTNLVEQTEILDKAVWKKWNKYTRSGLIVIGIGLILIAVGIVLNTGTRSIAGLLIGIGGIIVLIGIIRALIGLINPLAPSDLHPESGVDVEEPPVTEITPDQI